MADIPEPSTIITVRHGQRVGLLDLGKPDGVPLFHFHGSGSSRFEVLPFAETARHLGVRLIGLDRPGVGRSDPTPHDTLLDWPDTVSEVADGLGIERFAVEGMSAGGPYALACAFKIAPRLTACGLVGTTPPPELMLRAAPLPIRIIWSLATHFPRAFQMYLRLAVADSTPDVETMEKRIQRWGSWTGTADRALLADPASRRALARSLAENLRQGAAAARREVAIELNWGFDPSKITFRPIYLWHGEQDRIMPVAASRLLAKTLPDCRARFFADDGHFSVLMNHAPEIFSSLTA